MKHILFFSFILTSPLAFSMTSEKSEYIKITPEISKNVRLEKGARLFLSQKVHEVEKTKEPVQFTVQMFCHAKNKNSFSECELLEINALKNPTTENENKDQSVKSL